MALIAILLLVRKRALSSPLCLAFHLSQMGLLGAKPLFRQTRLSGPGPLGGESPRSRQLRGIKSAHAARAVSYIR
jgi:hypothetical protein